MLTINEVLSFLKKADTYYLATDDAGQPRVRPFGTINLFEGSLYIQTGNDYTTHAGNQQYAEQVIPVPHAEGL